MPQNNDPSLVAKALAKAQSVEARLNDLAAIAMDASQGINAGGGTGAGYWIGPTQIIYPNATHAVGQFAPGVAVNTDTLSNFTGGVNAGGGTGAGLWIGPTQIIYPNATHAIGQFAPGVGIRADSIHTSANAQVDGTASITALSVTNKVSATGGVDVGGGTGAGLWIGPTQIIYPNATHAVGQFAPGVGIRADSIHTSASAQVDGTLTTSGIAVTGGGITATNLHVTSNAQVDGGTTVSGTLTAGGISTAGISASSIHTSAAAQVDGVLSTGGKISAGGGVDAGGGAGAGYWIGGTQVILANATFGIGLFNGVGITGAASIHTSGVGQFDGGVTTTGITANSIHTSANAQFDGTTTFGGTLNAPGGVQAGGGGNAGYWIGATQVILANATFGAGSFNVGIGAPSIHTSGVGQFDGGTTTTGITANSIHTSGNGQFDGTVAVGGTLNAPGGVQAGGGANAGYWVGATQVIAANATFGAGSFNVGIGAPSIHTSGVGQFDGGTTTTGITANSIHTSGVGQFDGGSTISGQAVCNNNLYVRGTLFGISGAINIGDTVKLNNGMTQGAATIVSAAGQLGVGSFTVGIVAPSIHTSGTGQFDTGVTVPSGHISSVCAHVNNPVSASNINDMYNVLNDLVSKLHACGMMA